MQVTTQNAFDKLRQISFKVLTSTWFCLFQVLVGSICFFLDIMIPNAGTQMEIIYFAKDLALAFYVSVIIISLITIEDISVSFLPGLLLSICMLKLYGAKAVEFFQFIPMLCLLVIVVIARFFIFKNKIRIGRLALPMLSVFIAVTMGGIGYLNSRQYFDMLPLSYTLGLGFGMFACYIFISSNVFVASDIDSLDVLFKALMYMGLFCAVIVYISLTLAFVENKNVYYYAQWKNNLSTFMLFAAPVPFYYAMKKRRKGINYFIYGIVLYFACMLTFSRGGIFVGSLMMLGAVFLTILYTPNSNRYYYLAIALIVIITLSIFMFYFKSQISTIKETIQIKQNEARWHLIREAIKNFKEMPVCGKGLAYFSQNNYYSPVGTIYLFHNSIMQVISSFGLVGVIAYSYQFLARLGMIFSKKRKRTLVFLLIFASIELMSLVNPGLMVPASYAPIFVFVLVVCEQSYKRTYKDDRLIYKNLTKVAVI